jgi:hypothetical protein
MHSGRPTKGSQFRQTGKRISVVAYADDITVFLTRQEDIETVQQAVRTYEQATGAQLNPRKSKTLALGGWSTPIAPLGIEQHPHVKILGVMFGTTTDETTKESWTRLNNTVRAQARTAYDRKMCLAHWVKYVHTYLLAKIWYLAQIIPPTMRHIQQLMTICTGFIWKEATFRVPVTTLQLPKHQGGWTLPDIALKCQALLLGRMWNLATRNGSVTAAFLRTWNLTDRVDNPLIRWNPTKTGIRLPVCSRHGICISKPRS